MTSLQTLGYVRHAGEGVASLEPYAAGEEFQAGDFIVSRGQMKWAEVLPHAVATQLSIDDERFVTRGGGGRLLLSMRGLVFGVEGELLYLHEQEARQRMNTKATFNLGAVGGLTRHLAPRIDVYGLISTGVSLALAEATDSGNGAAPYLSMMIGTRLSLGRIFAKLEAGGIATTVYSGWEGSHADVRQLAPVARVSLGINTWPNLTR